LWLHHPTSYPIHRFSCLAIISTTLPEPVLEGKHIPSLLPLCH